MKKLLIFLIGVLYLTGCSGSKETGNELAINIDPVKVDSWVNLMPGDEPSFFVTGLLRIRNNNDFEIDSLKLRLNVYQDDNILYSIKPAIDASAEEKSIFKPGIEREFTFAVERGQKINKNMNFDKPVDLEFMFSAEGKLCCYKLDSVNVEKAY